MGSNGFLYVDSSVSELSHWRIFLFPPTPSEPAAAVNIGVGLYFVHPSVQWNGMFLAYICVLRLVGVGEFPGSRGRGAQRSRLRFGVACPFRR